jgi:hypothetical protein
MSVHAPNAPATSPATNRSQGRAYFWFGIAACLLGLALFFVQLGLKFLFVPWYSPALATLGAALLLVSVSWRRSIPRVVALVLVAALAGLQWYFLVSFVKLPDYEGPAQAGKPMPAFRTTLADGSSFTQDDLRRDGSRTVMVFFRGRW